MKQEVPMYDKTTLDEHVRNMRRVGELLVPHNFPKVPAEQEEAIAVLKNRDATVDGYEVVLHYSKADYGTHFLESFQVVGKYVPFLPFGLVCKLGKRFLGPDNLSLVELFKDNRKIYCWTVAVTKEGTAVKTPVKEEGEDCVFEGFRYTYMDPKTVNFY
jgi:hypothetical protein